MKFFADLTNGSSAIKCEPTIIMWRTINDCLKYVKSKDPRTAITRYFIDQKCKLGEVNYTTAGKKILVDLNSLIRLLNK